MSHAHREYLTVPDLTEAPAWRLGIQAILGAGLSPLYWVLAHLWNPPGLDFHRLFAGLGLRLLLSGISKKNARLFYRLMFRPMDSTRYFEFDFAWKRLISYPPKGQYLDISSPRFLPALFLYHNNQITGHLLNPDKSDLEETEELITSVGLEKRCKLYAELISETSLEENNFDIVTSISVLEHIPEDKASFYQLWKLVKLGGRFIVTVPCAASSWEQYIDRNEYGLLDPDEEGLVFWQRFYDQALLEERFFSIAGKPKSMVVYGEKRKGIFASNAYEKRSNANYAFWREPLMMGVDYSFFPSISELTGEGVVGLEFEKT